MERYYKKISIAASEPVSLQPSSDDQETTPVDKSSGKKPRIEIKVSDADIIGDPGIRKPIESYPYEIRDSLRRRYLAKGPCQPVGHNFPQSYFSGSKRRFLSKWFKQYPWLEYSISKDKAYCMYCYLFTSTSRSGGTAYTEDGFGNWRKAIENFIDHEGGIKSDHNRCRLKMERFRNQRENIDYVLSSRNIALENDYRSRLTTVLHVARFLLGEGLTFRGHDESEESMHRGHFLGLIDWICLHFEEVRKIMESAPKNNKLISSTIQRDLIESCAMEMRKTILNEIGDKFYSLLIDESRDSSVKEQMAVVLRFVDSNGEVKERFLGVVHVTDTSARSLKNAIDSFFVKNGLSISRLRGQGYDGASNMRGEFNGLQRLILDENKHAHYVHCYAHQLQLAVVSAAQDKEVVSTFFDYVSLIVNMVGASCKSKDALRELHHEETVSKIQAGEVTTGRGKNQEISLTRPGDTRWGSHYKTLIRLFDMWNSVGEVLCSIYRDGQDGKTRGNTKALHNKMYDFEFVFIGKLICNILGYTNTLSKILQQKDQNIGTAIHLVQVVKQDLQKYRTSGWEALLKEVTQFCENQEIGVPNMDDVIPGRSMRLLDGVAKTYFHHYRAEIFVKVLDLVVVEFGHRFKESETDLLRSIVCLDPSNSFASFDLDRLVHMAELYSEDFSSGELMELRHQLGNYVSAVRLNEEFSNLSGLGVLAKKMVEQQYDVCFPLVYQLVELALVLPVATATVERCFSAMNIVKSDLRNRMGDELLSDTLLCYIERKIFLTIEDEAILQRFQSLSSRKNYLPPVCPSHGIGSSSVTIRKT